MAEKKDPAPAKASADETQKEAEQAGKLNLKGTEPDEPAAPSPPGFKTGMSWSSDDARKAYQAEGSSLEEQQQLGAEGQPGGST